LMTMVIAIPTGVKVFNWIFTMYRGRVRFKTPMLWFMGFVVTFTLGGLAGVMLSVPPADFQFHNSLFLVAHFHTMIIGGVVFGMFAGYTYWFPKFTGFTLNERLGKIAFWFWLIGFLTAFIPLYILGFMGATRRLDHYDPSIGWQGLFIVAAVGVGLICIGVGFQVLQLIVSIVKRNENRVSSDPWNGRTLEWSTHTPIPEYNFARIPVVHERDDFWEQKQSGKAAKQPITDIWLPKNTAIGLFIGGFAFLTGFSAVWHIVWLAVLGIIGVVTSIIVRVSSDDTEEKIEARDIEKQEDQVAKKRRYA